MRQRKEHYGAREILFLKCLFNQIPQNYVSGRTISVAQNDLYPLVGI